MDARTCWIVSLVACGLVFSPAALAQNSASAAPSPQTGYRQAMEQADLKIAVEVQAHSQLVSNLEHLTTEIGPRLTGSPQMQEASRWTLEKFRSYGLQAHLETTTIPHAWTRGVDSARIDTPIQRILQVRSFGWSQATPGPVTAPLVILDLDSPDALHAAQGKIRGAIVLMGKPHVRLHPNHADNAYDAVIPQPRGVPKANAMTWPQRRRLFRQILLQHPAALIMDAGKPFELFTMGSISGYQPSAAPIAFMDHADYSLLYRLQQDGHPATLTINLTGKFSPRPAPASITVAQIRGSKHPNQQVIIGGHLDSWDLGQGALDNGTGAMAVLEAARTLKALGWTPDRTITFILFTGEEESGLGAQLFLHNHAGEIPRMDAVLIDDTGTGEVTSVALENLWNTGPLLAQVYQPLQEVFNLRPISTRYFGASDHVDFLRVGVPAYFCVQKPADYGYLHHSQDDVFNELRPRQANEGAALLAAWAWNVAQLPQSFPHHAPNPDLQ